MLALTLPFVSPPAAFPQEESVTAPAAEAGAPAAVHATAAGAQAPGAPAGQAAQPAVQSAANLAAGGVDPRVRALRGTSAPDGDDAPSPAPRSEAATTTADAAVKLPAGPPPSGAHQAVVAAAVPPVQTADSTVAASFDPTAETAPDPTTASQGDGASSDAGGDTPDRSGGEGQAPASPATLKPGETGRPAETAPAPGGGSTSATPSPADAATVRPPLPAGPLQASAAQATPQAAAMVAAAVVSNAVAAASAGLRRTRFEVQLDGDDLGRIDVRLDIGRGGRVGAKLTVDSAEARDVLQNDARALQRTLEQAGFRLPEGGFTVEVRDGGGGDPQARRESAQLLREAVAADDNGIGRDAAPIAYHPLRASASALDVRV